MSKIELNTSIADYGFSQINANFQLIEDELNQKVLYRDNPVGEPNSMEDTDLDMNGNRIFNLPEPVSASEAARLQDILNATGVVATANLVAFTPTGDIVANNVQGAIVEVDQELHTHEAAVSNAHSATAINFTQAGTGALTKSVQTRMRDTVFLSDFATGDGVTNDTAAIQNAVNACPANVWLDGAGKTYLIDSSVNSLATTFFLRNANFVFSTSYSTQGKFVITALTTKLENINVDGGRGTYKVGSEPWTQFTSFLGYGSIEPTSAMGRVFGIVNMNAAASVQVKNVNFKNVHAVTCLEVTTFGTVTISDCFYRNVSNKTFHVYHSADNGVTQQGRTIVTNVYAEDVGLLPTNYLVDGVPKVYPTDAYAPQGSFNFIVSFGDFQISNAVVWNYAATGVCSDRNISFASNNTYIQNTSNKGFSNNPSGAFWIEATKKSAVSNLIVDIQNRDTRDFALDSSALQLFLTEDQQFVSSNIILRGNKSSAVTRRAIRGSFFATSVGQDVLMTNTHIDGLYVANAINCAYLPNSLIRLRVKMDQLFAESGAINIEQPNVMDLNSLQTSGDVTVTVAGNPGVTGSIAIASLRNSNVNAVNFSATVAGSVAITDNQTINGNVAVTCTGPASISRNKAIVGAVNLTSGSSTAGTFEISNNGLITDITTVTAAKTAIVNGNNTSRRIEIKDVQTFTVCSNNAKTDQPESIIWINPVTGANVIAGSVAGNNVLIKTGTVGAGYVTVSGGTGISDVANNKITVAWV